MDGYKKCWEMANEKTVEVSAHGAETSEAPSAPPIVHAEVQRSDLNLSIKSMGITDSLVSPFSTVTPTVYKIAVYKIDHGNAHVFEQYFEQSDLCLVSVISEGSSPYSEPPPSYQMAVGYPTTPYPTHGLQHMPTPGIPPVYAPKPHQMYSPQPNQPPIYYATHAVGVTQFPQGERIPVTTAQVVVAVGNGFTCPHCNVGVITKETDMCCMLCLILLTIFTFPFGLVFLCCLPCTVSRRCSNCRRTA
ncbi:hypothetical protein ANCCEY_09593 [Ancylostoma ceylanicum]|uniref:Membrane protein BRI3 n=1 Tax=Ancylostoma ceylanicum TaxID=53326 RepID=A0A0D6LGX8_9BILA|nr:hypothetical protein ANCCEY_09593 [Ancylostoma ceylanicum]